jgi:hypothetical protein
MPFTTESGLETLCGSFLTIKRIRGVPCLLSEGAVTPAAVAGAGLTPVPPPAARGTTSVSLSCLETLPFATMRIGIGAIKRPSSSSELSAVVSIARRERREDVRVMVVCKEGAGSGGSSGLPPDERFLFGQGEAVSSSCIRLFCLGIELSERGGRPRRGIGAGEAASASFSTTCAGLPIWRDLVGGSGDALLSGEVDSLGGKGVGVRLSALSLSSAMFTMHNSLSRFWRQ